MTWLVVPQPRGSGDVDDALAVERGARVLRGGPGLLPRPGRRRPGPGAAARLTRTSIGRCAVPGHHFRVHGAAMGWPIRTIPRYSPTRYHPVGRVSGRRTRGLIRGDRRAARRAAQAVRRSRLCATRRRSSPRRRVRSTPTTCPIEAVQTDEEREIAASLPARRYAPGGAAPQAVSRGIAAIAEPQPPTSAAQPARPRRPDPRPAPTHSTASPRSRPAIAPIGVGSPRGSSSMVRAAGLYPAGSRFESWLPYHRRSSRRVRAARAGLDERLGPAR